jgi:arginine/lysine/ornithine decarboxylase
MNIFEHMVECLKYLKEKESVYREAVDNANSFLHTEFKTTMEALTEALIPKIAETEKEAAKDQDRKSMLAEE